MPLKPWSISTTVRSPDRLRGFLQVLQTLEGVEWNHEYQILFQVRLIQARQFGVGNRQFCNNLPEEDIILLDSGNKISELRAKEIFARKNYLDPSMRGRTSFKPLQKMGFAALDNGCINITGLGKLLLAESRDYGDIFLRSLLKWQLPNPLDGSFPSSQGYNIKPFAGVLHLINEVNKEAKKENMKPKGLSLEEFGAFALTLIDWREIASTAKKIITLRKLLAETPLSERQALFGSEVARLLSCFELKHLRDYADNAVRYFRITKYVCLRGAETHIDLEPARARELKSLLSKDNASPSPGLIKSSEHYSYYLGDAETPELPGETRDDLLEAIRLVTSAIEKLGSEVTIPSLDGMPARELKTLRDDLRKQHQYLARTKQKIDFRNPDKAEELVAELRQLASNRRYKPEDGMTRPLRLEYLVGILLDCVLNDAKSIAPNYPMDDHGIPTHTAPGGMADIECCYNQFVATCEVTMMGDSKQWMHEAQPVMRHLREFEESCKEYPAYCLFVAPRMHVDSLNMFNYSVKNGYEGKKQRIAPLTITQLCDIADFCIQRMREGHPIKSADIQKLLDLLVDSIGDMQTTEEWRGQVSGIMEQWKQAA